MTNYTDFGFKNIIYGMLSQKAVQSTQIQAAKIKDYLARKPIMSLPTLDQPFVLVGDYSYEGLDLALV